MGSSSRCQLISRYWALGLLGLIVASYRLWVPALWSDNTPLPPVPVSGFPSWFDLAYRWIGLPVLVIGCVLAIGFRGHSRSHIGWALVGCTLIAGVALDQHRLQPWVYQTLLYSAWLVLLPNRITIGLMQILTISIYFYSSIGKFDYQFVHTVGQDFLATAGMLFGLDITTWDETLRSRVVLVFPIAELTTALMLMLPRTRRWGGYVAIAMHVSLIFLLSPLGMNHSVGVLAWNAVLAGQAYLLFAKRSVATAKAPVPDDSNSDEVNLASGLNSRSWRSVVAFIILGLALALPLSERRDQVGDAALHWDHWLSWSLYSPHNSRFNLEVHRSLVSEFPESWRGAVREDIDADGWHPLDLGQLSLDVRGVPIVPQARYQLGLAVAIARSHGTREGVGSSLRGVLRFSSERLDGNRREEWLMNLKAMKKHADAFWLLEKQSERGLEGKHRQ